MQNPDSREQILVKWPNHGSGEVYAEKLCSELGRITDIPIMRADIGCCRGEPVILAYNFLSPNEDLKEGGDFFENYEPDSGKPGLAPGYTFERIKAIVEPYGLLPGLLDMIVFDALVANSDRHQDNWGLCFKDDQVRFAPLYDHGSSLGWNLAEDRVNTIMSNGHRFQGFINRGKTLIAAVEGCKTNHFDLMTRIGVQHRIELMNSIRKVGMLEEKNIWDVINSMPSEIMSDLRKEFVCRLLLERKHRIEGLVN